MFKLILTKLFYGFLYGVGFTVGVVVVSMFVVSIKSQEQFSPFFSGEESVSEVPSIEEQERKKFHGSTATYAGGFKRKGVLEVGDGRIDGRIEADGRNLEGIKIRYALNGEVFSTWATTETDGRFEVAVPYGEYRVDGFEMNHSTAREVLHGLTNFPRNGHSTGVFTVSEDEVGTGLILRFVEPIKRLKGKRTYGPEDYDISAFDIGDRLISEGRGTYNDYDFRIEN